MMVCGNLFRDKYENMLTCVEEHRCPDCDALLSGDEQ